MDSNLQTIIDSAMDTLSDALEDFLDTVLENAPTTAAVGGAAVSTALVMNPSLPMTMASGVPPGNHITLGGIASICFRFHFQHKLRMLANAHPWVCIRSVC